MTKQKAIKIFGIVLIVLGIAVIGFGIWQRVSGVQWGTVPMEYDWTEEDLEDAMTLEEYKESQETSEETDETDEKDADETESESAGEESSGSEDEAEATEAGAEEGTSDAEE